ncbi:MULTISPECIES: sugar transferase [Weissella]|uniref:sugar transferase n=1 Tax=Weissella TaxID=46255 RepID=UPI00223AFEED|nr:sugar transferase [Weissella cibaria]
MLTNNGFDKKRLKQIDFGMSWRNMYRKIVKRSFDVMFSAMLIIALLIPMAVIAIIVKSTSKGPILFKQERFGIGNTTFVILKFRSMANDAPILSNQNFSQIDSFVTPFGSFMRRTSLDELPQLFNVLWGKMSFIGPRPLARTDIDVVNLRSQSGANRVQPGITGLAQVSGRNMISDQAKASFDAEYAANVSFWLDLKIVFYTLAKVVSQEGINQNDYERK